MIVAASYHCQRIITRRTYFKFLTHSQFQQTELDSELKRTLTNMARSIIFVGKFRLTSGQHASAIMHTKVTTLK